jgi:uncharacterized protein YigA (DUF484 family)
MKEKDMPPANDMSKITEDDVREWLESHEDFFIQYPEVLTKMALPEVKHGGNVVDFQSHLVGRLQKTLDVVGESYEGLISASRDNRSTQTQVNEAVLLAVRAPSLERLYEAVTQDMVRLFDVDVVRLAIESPVAEHYEVYYPEHEYSGISFIDPGAVDSAIGAEERIRLVAETRDEYNDGLSQIFADCLGVTRSCALLRLRLHSHQRHATLAFGVRHPGRFNPQQSGEMLKFLADVVEYRLDHLLLREGLDELQ